MKRAFGFTSPAAPPEGALPAGGYNDNGYNNNAGGAGAGGGVSNKVLLAIAKAVSGAFSPFYLPFLAFAALFAFSYLRLYPSTYKLTVLGVVLLFSALIPQASIGLYRRINGWQSNHLRKRERRVVPYALSIASYCVLFRLLDGFNLPRVTLGIIAGAVALQVICALVNVVHKVSTHAAGAGAVTGAIAAFALIFNFNPLLWLCLSIFIEGVVCTARLLLRQHKLSELGWGTLIGVACGFASLILT